MKRFIVDAFVGEGFRGNRAAVVELEEWLADGEMLAAAKDNGLPETAFFKRCGDHFALRWFTPDIEMDLCGHATLATAHVVAHILRAERSRIHFETASGDVFVDVAPDGMLTLDFPSRMPLPDVLPAQIAEALSVKPKEVLKSRDYVLLYDSQEEIEQMRIDRALFDLINIDPGGVVITVAGRSCDFVSRFFMPQATILEDPVTGSAHCSLVPFWAERLGKEEMVAQQLSATGGVLYCRNCGARVHISGYASEAAPDGI